MMHPNRKTMVVVFKRIITPDERHVLLTAVMRVARMQDKRTAENLERKRARGRAYHANRRAGRKEHKR